MAEKDQDVCEDVTKPEADTTDDTRPRESPLDIYHAISALDQQEAKPIAQVQDHSDPPPTTITVIPEPEAPKSSTARPRCPKNISHLPNRLLTKIFELIPNTQHEALKEVSPHWRSFIDRQVGVPINIGKSSEYADRDMEFSAVGAVAEMGISYCYMSNMHHFPLPAFKYPHLVRRIQLIDYVAEGYFLKLLQPLLNLRHLSLDLSTLHYLEFLNISIDFLTRLEILQICNEEYCTSWNDEVHPSKNEVRITLDNSFSLLKVRKFNCLKALFIGFPVCTPDNRNADLVLAIFHCLLNHSNTIRTLEIYFQGKLESTDEDDEPEITALDTFDISALSVVKLQRLVMNLQSAHQDQDIVPHWCTFLNTQTELQRCCLLPNGPEDDNVVELVLPTELITKNAPTLLIFRWLLEEDWATTEPTQLNCEILQPCVHLYDIHLAASGSIPYTLSNVNLLPSSLRSIVLEGINMHKEDIDAIVTGLPILQKLSLSSVGQETGFGMTMTTLKGIYERKHLNRLVINYGFNLENLHLTMAEVNSFSFILTLIKNKIADDEDCYFHMQLCDNGLEYAVIP